MAIALRGSRNVIAALACAALAVRAAAACGGHTVGAPSDAGGDGPNAPDAGEPGDATVVVAPDASSPVDGADAREPTVEAEAGPSIAPPCAPADAGDESDASSVCAALIADLVQDGGVCPGGSVTFHLDAPGWFVGGSYDTPAPGANWLTVFCPSGLQLPFETGGVNEVNGGIECSTCQPTYAYALGGFIGQSSDAGSSQTWDGLYFEPGECTTDASLEPLPRSGRCVTRGCAPPGRYWAVFCAYPSPDESVDASCTTVPFDYPTAATVRATLPVEGGCP